MKKSDIIIGLISLVIALILTYHIYDKYGNQGVNKLITKDTLFLCPGSNLEGELQFISKDDKKYEREVCRGNSIGSYTCQNDYCKESLENQNINYIDYNKGIALITDEASLDSKISFLYNFKDEIKISDKYNFYSNIYEYNNKTYFLVIDKIGNSGIIDNQGKIIINNVYKQIGIDPTNSKLSGQVGNLIVAIRNNKLGFLNIVNGKEITNFEFDKIGFINVSSINDYSVDINRDTLLLNPDLKEVYVESHDKGKIINMETGRIRIEFLDTYDFSYPLTNDLIIIEDNKEIDIVNNELESILDEKISINGYATYNIEDNKLSIYDVTMDNTNLKYTLDINKDA